MRSTIEPQETFDQETRNALARLRESFEKVIAALPTRIANAADVHRALHIDAKLGWRIFKVATDRSLAAGLYVPGRASVRTFFAAARKRGVPREVIEEARQAADGFERLVKAHADDRAAFDSVVSARAPHDQAERFTLDQKRTAYRANRHLRGVHAKTQLKCVVVQPASDPSQLDLVAVQGYLRLRRLRHEAPLAVTRIRLSDDDRRIRSPAWEPLDNPEDGSQSTTLLREFCSEHMSGFRTVRTCDGFVHGELVCDGVGNRSAIDCVDGYFGRGVAPRYQDERNRYGEVLTWVPIPCETLVIDLIVRHGTFGSIAPVAAAYGGALKGHASPTEPSDSDRLPLHESVVHLGQGLSACHCADMPRHTELCQYVFDRVGWDAGEFDVFRCRVRYPIMLSWVLCRFALPESPK